jgi:hypothetical protein
VAGLDEVLSYTVEKLCTGMQLSERSTNRSLEKSSSAFARRRFSPSIRVTEPHEVLYRSSKSNIIIRPGDN